MMPMLLLRDATFTDESRLAADDVYAPYAEAERYDAVCRAA